MQDALFNEMQRDECGQVHRFKNRSLYVESQPFGACREMYFSPNDFTNHSRHIRMDII